MKHIANILTDKNFPKEDLYNIINDINDIEIGIPTLIIGWEYTKNLFPNANILDWEINRNIFWTFGKREKNQRYVETLEEFKTLAVKRFIKSIEYRFVNILTKSDGIDNLKTLLDLGYNFNVFINNDILYINCCGNNIVYGYSLRDIEYGGGNKKELFSAIYSNKDINFINIKDLSPELKLLFNNCLYVIPCLY